MLEQLFSAWGVRPTSEAWQNLVGHGDIRHYDQFWWKNTRDSRAETVADVFANIKKSKTVSNDHLF